MLSAIAAVLLQTSLPAAASAEPNANRVDWIARPDGRALAECIPGSLPDRAGATLVCLSAPGDRLADCRVDAPAPVDRRLEKTLLCSAKHFRVRVTDAHGKVVTGAAVEVPLNVSQAR